MPCDFSHNLCDPCHEECRRRQSVKEEGAAHGVDRAPGLHQHAIAGGLDDAAAVAGDGGVYQVSSVPTQRMSVPNSSAPISRL